MGAIYSIYDDKYLVHLLNQGNEQAFEELYNRYWKLLYARAWNTLRDRQLAQDIVQEVFGSLWQRRSTIVIEHSIEAWLHQAIRFQCMKQIAADHSNKAFIQRLRSVTELMQSNNSLPSFDSIKTIEQACELLPEHCRETFRLSRLEQLSYQEIADRQAIAVKTVEKRITLSLKHLRIKLIHLFFSLL